MLANFTRRLSSAPRSVRFSLARSFATETESSEIKPFEPKNWFPDFGDTSVRAELNKIREIENDMLQTLNAKTTPIDWSYWEEEIKYPGLVNELKELHDATPVPDLKTEQAKAAEDIEAIFTPIIDNFRKLASEAENETVDMEKRAEEVSYLKDNIRDLTVEEFLERYPTVKANIEDDIAKNKWFVNDN